MCPASVHIFKSVLIIYLYNLSFAREQQLKIPDRTKKELKGLIKLMDAEISDKYTFEHIVELVDCVQAGYTRLNDLMNTEQSPLSAVPVDMRDSIMDFFEKVLMTKNHKLLFSPEFSMDEEYDSKVHKRIRQLSWINAKHLDCTIDEGNPEVRDLVYNSITGTFLLVMFHCVFNTDRNSIA